MGNAAFRKSVLKEIGGFDESLHFGAEEVDLCWRIYLKGYRIEYVPDAIIDHVTNRGIKDFFMYGVATRELARKYHKIFQIVSLRELVRLSTYANERGKPYSFLNTTKPLAVMSGFIFQILREKIRLISTRDRVDFRGKCLQLDSPIKYLNIAIDSNRIAKPNHIIWWKTRMGKRVFDIKSKNKYDLEGVSGDIWEMMMRGKTEDEIVEIIAREYGAAEHEARTDVTEFVLDLFCNKLLYCSKK